MIIGDFNFHYAEEDEVFEDLEYIDTCKMVTRPPYTPTFGKRFRLDRLCYLSTKLVPISLVLLDNIQETPDGSLQITDHKGLFGVYSWKFE